jgi:Txe/YoeB family toxin of toxin-antitoxin system
LGRIPLLANNRQKNTKAYKLINQRYPKNSKELQRTPNEGIGKPEPLKHGLSGYWSRRINDEHRIVYKQDGSILIAQLRYHYGT